MNWKETITKSVAYLDAKGVGDSVVAAESLAARLLGAPRGMLAASAERTPAARELEAMRRGLARLAKGEPLQYVLGEWDFRRLTLKCDRRALIPRPETEELVTRALAHLKARFSDAAARPFVVDVGTGTGAIILALAQEYAGEAIFLGTDVSADALQLARENAARSGLDGRVRFALADGLDDFDEPGLVDVLVSNPPYVPRAVCETLAPQVRDWEPRLALDGGETGLDFYARYLADAINVLKPGGAAFFEIGDGQGEGVRALMFECGFEHIRIERDFAGHDRYASAVLP